MITDSSGTVKGASDSLPFGDEGGRSGEGEKHRYTSYERDRESGTDYAVNRQYSQVTGRFNRPDPVGGSMVVPQSLNRYSYATDPINVTDPSGLFKEAVWMLWNGRFFGGGRGFGFGQSDYDFWGARIADLPGFGTMWGSMSAWAEWRYDVSCCDEVEV